MGNGIRESMSLNLTRRHTTIHFGVDIRIAETATKPSAIRMDWLSIYDEPMGTLARTRNVPTVKQHSLHKEDSRSTSVSIRVHSGVPRTAVINLFLR